MTWQDSLLAWFDASQRDLPWRRSQAAYGVWVSEIMLQQTQVATVIPYWQRWMERFPTIESLAVADEQEVLALWQGLGYYRRCRMLQQGSRFIAVNGMPTSASEWREVPGVGPYTAGAIASIALNEAAPLVDGNVERVFARLKGNSASGAALNARAWEWARENMRPDHPGAWNQALMELGATVCTPVRPACNRCPVSSVCEALKLGLVEELPTRVAKPKPIALRHVVWIPLHEGELGVRQISTGDWWEGMWEFPRAELTPRKSHAAPLESESDPPDLREMVGPGWPQFVGTVKHAVTNHRITIDVHLVRCEERSNRLVWHAIQGLEGLAMPSPQRKILSMAGKLGLLPSSFSEQTSRVS